jgi:hypothetical protein
MSSSGLDWYIVVKTIKGRRYHYRQKTWREGKHVRTRSQYIGPVGGDAVRFNGFRDLTIGTVESLKGKSTVFKQFVSDLTNSPDLKQAEREVVRDTLAAEEDVVDVKHFTNCVRDRLLPLTVSVLEEHSETETTHVARFARVSLAPELRGNIARYAEHIFQSPIDTTAGELHFSEAGADKYFAHSRIEDMADGQTRRIVEVQSDLFQKGRLELEPDIGKTYLLTEEEVQAALLRGEKVFALEQNIMTSDVVLGRQIESPDDLSTLYEGYVGEAHDKSNLNRLKPYRNTWYERVIQEEIKKAAKDGKTRVQIPTGETAMRIEGLIKQDDKWETVGKAGGDTCLSRAPGHMKIGNEVYNGVCYWIITDVFGNGKFQALERDVYITAQRMKSGELTERDRRHLREGNMTREEYGAALANTAETFDISGRADTSNPIYRFYEREVSKHITGKFGARRVKDACGVEWWEIEIDRQLAGRPVFAF